MFKAKIYDDGSYADFLPKGCRVQNRCKTIEHAKQKVKNIFAKQVNHTTQFYIEPCKMQKGWQKTNLKMCWIEFVGGHLISPIRH